MLTFLTFLGGALIDSTFNTLLSTFGEWGTFSALAAVCLAGGALVYLSLPETKGRTLWEVSPHISRISPYLPARDQGWEVQRLL